MADKVVIDANIALEIFLVRARRQKVIAELAGLGSNEVRLHISSLSVSHFMYFVELENKSKQNAHKYIQQFPVLDVNEEDVEWAFANDQGDYEAALQVACAIRHGCQKLLTLDQNLKKHHQKHIAVSLIN